MNQSTIIAKIKQLEDEVDYWKKAHIDLQTQHAKLQKRVIDLQKETGGDGE